MFFGLIIWLSPSLLMVISCCQTRFSLMYNYKLKNENKKFVKFPLTKSDQLYKSSEILVSKETQTCQSNADLALTTNSTTTLTNNNLDPKRRRSTLLSTTASTPHSWAPSLATSELCSASKLYIDVL